MADKDLWRISRSLTGAAVLLLLATAAPAAADPGMGPPVSPASSRMRRLTAFEYEKTVGDLLPIDARAIAEGLATDESAGMFLANTTAAVDRFTVERTLEAAGKAAALAVQHPDRLLGCEPGESLDACARRFLPAFGRRAFRRPLTPVEIAGLLRVYRRGKAKGGPVRGTELAIRAALSSPSFLYVLEEARTPDAADAERQKLGPYGIASRLSYFLWRSLPDDELLHAAQEGWLTTADDVGIQAHRMLGDPRTRRTTSWFHQRWLNVDHLENLEKGGFRGWSADTGPQLKAQFDRVVDYVLWESDGRLETLLTTPVTFVNGPLATLLGVLAPGASGPAFVRVEGDRARRAGILTLPGFLAKHAQVNETSPVKRGVFLRERILCQDVPPPPSNMVATVIPTATKDAVTLRERLEEHRAEVGCSRCHKLVDSLGLSLENYDAAGAWRDAEDGHPIDTAGDLVGTDVDGPFTDVVHLGRKLAASRHVRDCVVRKWFSYSVGRPETPADDATLADLGRRFAASDNNILALVVALTQTDPFLYREASKPTLTASAPTR